jgi:hypothetical protein
MTENQKLREALQAISHIDDTTNHSVDASAALDRIGQIARQALALPTADHLPDAGKRVNGLTEAETDASASVSGLTAAPVCEREAFEREMSKPPFEFCMDRWPDDGSSYAWPGNYAAYHTQCAWDAWQARAALSAGDAVDVPQSTPIACAVHVAGRTFEKGVPFCDVIDYIESNTTRWVASSDRYPPEGERVFFMDLATDIVGFDMWAGEGFIWMPSHWMPIPPAPAMRKDKP